MTRILFPKWFEKSCIYIDRIFLVSLGGRVRVNFGNFSATFFFNLPGSAKIFYVTIRIFYVYDCDQLLKNVPK